MIHYLITILKHYLFWFLFFVLGRLFFLLANISGLSGIALTEILMTFIQPLRLDYSTISYIMVIPFILITIKLAVNKNFPDIILSIYSIILITLCSIIIFSDIAVYSEWSTKINYKALTYLQNPDEVIKSASTFHTVMVITGSILMAAAAIFIYLRFIIKPKVKTIPRFYFQSIGLLIVGLSIQFAGIRGGISQIPISQSAAYFSKNQTLNDAAVNPTWNLMHSIVNFSSLNQKNPFAHLKQNTAESLVEELFTIEKDTTIRVLKSQNVNIVLIVLESWSADLIETITGEKGITPYFNQLEKEGILFTRLYSNGHRSQQGLSALLSGFPPVPIHNITDNFEKYQKLNSIVRDLNGKGYNSSFYFGGDLVYGNLKAYMMANQFDKIVEEKDFPSNLERGKLSIFDEHVLTYHIKEMNQEKEPFFSMIFTGSTHSPYDEPKIVSQLDWKCAELPYLNSAKYTDYCIKKYLDMAKLQPWYANTLFILVADHSHRTHKERDYHSPEYQHIPMLWFGEVLKDEYRGTTVDKLCSQVDIPLTILKQLQISTDAYEWSLDIFNPNTEEFAAFETSWGLNWIRKEQFLRYDGFQNYFYPSSFENDSIKNREQLYGKSYLQILYQQYLDF